MSYLKVLIVFWVHLLCTGDTEQPVNLALGKPTRQSSTYTSFYSDKAVDGVLEHDTHISPCTHTDQDQIAWWTVDLQQNHSIHSVKIYSRGTYVCDSYSLCNGRLLGFRVHISDNVTISRFEKLCYQSEDSSFDLVIDVNCTSPTSGQFVTVSVGDKGGSAKILELCELQVFGDLVPPTFPHEILTSSAEVETSTKLPEISSAVTDTPRSCPVSIMVNPTSFITGQVLWSVTASSSTSCARMCCASKQLCLYVNFNKLTKTCSGYAKISDLEVTSQPKWQIWNIP